MPKIIKHDKNIGKKIGSLIILDWYTDRRAYYKCKCDCGKECVKKASDILSGNTSSCGCRIGKIEKIKENAKKMGMNTRQHVEKCDNCGKLEHYARGYCRNCYSRFMRNGKTDYLVKKVS